MSELRVGYNADVTLIFGGRFNFPEIAFVLTREYLQAAAQHEGEIKRLGAQILEQAKHYTDQSREYTARIATLEAELQLARADARSFEEQLGIMRERLNVEKQTRRSAPPLEAVIRIDLPSQEVKAAIERATPCLDEKHFFNSALVGERCNCGGMEIVMENNCRVVWPRRRA